jgi:hypothetical protein
VLKLCPLEYDGNKASPDQKYIPSMVFARVRTNVQMFCKIDISQHKPKDAQFIRAIYLSHWNNSFFIVIHTRFQFDYCNFLTVLQANAHLNAIHTGG